MDISVKIQFSGQGESARRGLKIRFSLTFYPPFIRFSSEFYPRNQSHLRRRPHLLLH